MEPSEAVEPDSINTEIALRNWARSIRAWQKSRQSRLSDEALIRRYPALGSTKTYKRILAGDTRELRVEDWAEKYRSVVAQIDAESLSATATELYDDLEPTRLVRAAVQNLVRSFGIERLVVIQGDTGCGKTSALTVVEDIFKGSVVRLEASEGWRSFAAAMGDIAVAIGVADDNGKLPISGAARLDAIIRHLGEARRIILIDEGHHMTAGVLNAIKTMINRTAALFVVAAQSTLWRKLQATSRQEAQQLLYNRLRQRVLLAGPGAEDVMLFLARRTGVELAARAAREIAQEAARYGSFAFLRRLAEMLNGVPAEDRSSATALEMVKNLKLQLV